MKYTTLIALLGVTNAIDLRHVLYVDLQTGDSVRMGTHLLNDTAAANKTVKADDLDSGDKEAKAEAAAKGDEEPKKADAAKGKKNATKAADSGEVVHTDPKKIYDPLYKSDEDFQ